MTNIYTFHTADQSDSFVCASSSLEEAQQHARQIFEHDNFTLEHTVAKADWDDFELKYGPLRMLPEDEDMDEEEKQEAAQSPTYFFIDPCDTKKVTGFNDLAVAGHVWTVIDVDGLLSIVPGWHFVNRFSYIVTSRRWTDESEEFVYA